MRRLAIVCVVHAIPLVLPSISRADEPSEAIEPPPTPPSAKPDTTFGRLDGDLAVVVGAGLTIGPRSPRAAADLRFRYLDTAGLFFDYEDGVLLGHGSDPQRVLAGGLELRPLFLGRWLTGREFGHARLDLALDSLGLELGAFVAQPVGASSLTERPGLQLGFGFELPIAANATGPWLAFHGGIRWSDRVLGGADVVDPADRALFLTITIAWHQILGVHLVDLGDRRSR